MAVEIAARLFHFELSTIDWTAPAIQPSCERVLLTGSFSGSGRLPVAQVGIGDVFADCHHCQAATRAASADRSERIRLKRTRAAYQQRCRLPTAKSFVIRGPRRTQLFGRNASLISVSGAHFFMALIM